MKSDLYLHLQPNTSIEQVFAAAAVAPQQLNEAVAQMGEGGVAWALEEAAKSLERLQGEFQTVPDLPTSEIRLNLETLILDIFMSSVLKNSDHHTLKLIPSMARQAARREVPFSSIVKNMRANQINWINSYFAASESRTLSPATVQRLVTCGAGVVDELIEYFVLAYLDERQLLMEGQIAKRRALVEKLITHEASLDEVDFKQIKDDHGLDLQHFHIGIVISDITAKHNADLSKLQRNLQKALAGGTALVVSATQQITWAWVSTPHPPTHVQIRRLEDALAHVTGARCALGEAANGHDGFRRTHLQARDVSSVATPSSIKGVLRWSDHVLTILLGQDLEKAAWYVHSVLGPLAEKSPKAAAHRKTLGAYLLSGNSLLHGAESLGIHRNTLVYRLQQIETLLNHSARERELELRCALHLVERFAERVLKENFTVRDKPGP